MFVISVCGRYSFLLNFKAEAFETNYLEKAIIVKAEIKKLQTLEEITEELENSSQAKGQKGSKVMKLLWF